MCENPIRRNSTNSVGKNDSGSQVCLQLQPSKRPEKYPFEILWQIEDCQRDEDARPSSDNLSRPKIAKAIRREDGSIIPESELNGIRTSVQAIYSAILQPLKNPDDPATQDARRTKTWYRHNYHEQWEESLCELERKHPVVALCASHWKAEHLFARHLQSKVINKMHRAERDSRKACLRES